MIAGALCPCILEEGKMSSHLKIIEDLEILNETQAHIIKALSTRLAELGEVDTFQDEIKKADDLYKKVMGDSVDGMLPFK